MTDKAFCPFYNVGYCKYKDKCSKEHAQDECEDRKCTNKLCHKRHRKSCRNGLECRFNAKNKCEFKHDQHIQTNHNDKKLELLSQTRSLNLEINNLKTSNENKLKELASLQEDIQQIKSDSLERENILKQEAVKLKNIIKEAQVKHDLQNKDLQIEILAKNDAILAFQKTLTEIDIKRQKALVQQKQDLSEKDKEISVLQNNLNTKSNKNGVEDFAPEEEGFQCKLCDKLYVSKDF
jgi:hypothetical protein